MSRPIRRFTEMLGLLSRGRLEEQLDEALSEAIATLEQQPNDQGSATPGWPIFLPLFQGTTSA